jgi:hypothetical protein
LPQFVDWGKSPTRAARSFSALDSLMTGWPIACISPYLEGHENARLAELHGAAHEEFRGHERLAATRAAAHQRGPPARQSAAGDFVETLDAGGAPGQLSRRGTGLVTVIFH